MRNIRNQEDLERLIADQVEEDLHLDYKAAEALVKDERKKIEISKDVSALANSDGGLIIYGIKEFSYPLKRYLPESITPVRRSLISREWLEQVINSGITPRIPDIKIVPVPINSSIDEVVYVVEVPKSETAHQAKDFRYYKRYNFESVPMYDYEVRDIMSRVKHPVIELRFKLDTIYRNDPPYSLPGFDPKSVGHLDNKLEVYAINVGGVYADYLNCFIEIPSPLLNIESYSYLDVYDRDGLNYKSIFCNNTIQEIKEVGVMGIQNKYWPSRYDPILPGTRKKLTTISLSHNSLPGDAIIYWTIYVDNAGKKTGQMQVKSIEATD